MTLPVAFGVSVTEENTICPSGAEFGGLAGVHVVGAVTTGSPTQSVLVGVGNVSCARAGSAAPNANRMTNSAWSGKSPRDEVEQRHLPSRTRAGRDHFA